MGRQILKLAFLILLAINPTLVNADAPTLSPPGNWLISSDYGPRSVTKGSWFHPGIDYAGGYENPIRPVDAGTIEE